MKKVNLFLVSLVTLMTLSIGLSSCGSGSSDYTGTWEGTRIIGGTAKRYIELTIYSDYSYKMKFRYNEEPYNERTGRWKYQRESVANVEYNWIKLGEGSNAFIRKRKTKNEDRYK